MNGFFLFAHRFSLPTLCKMVPSLMLVVFAALFVNVAFTTRYGIPDNRVHQFAGYLGIARKYNASSFPDENCTSNPTIIYASCGGSLVAVPGFPSRRLFLTARHCILVPKRDVTKKFLIHFGEFDKRVVDPSCSRVIGVASAGATVYTGTYAWFPETKSSGLDSSVGVGLFAEDYAVILLDKAVSTRDVDKEANIFDSSLLRNSLNLPIVGTAGYGIVGVGTTLDGTLGEPNVTSGDRNKNYVQMDVLSVQTTNIITSMNAARLEQAACNGDSGSAAIRITKVNNAYDVYGVVSNGDVQCRATNTYTRVGTPAFWAFLSGVKADVLSKA